jgi:hypothetical protein
VDCVTKYEYTFREKPDSSDKWIIDSLLDMFNEMGAAGWHLVDTDCGGYFFMRPVPAEKTPWSGGQV